MDSGTFAAEAEVEAAHWWFVGRRRLFGREIARLAIPSSARVLDLGSSTGTNLRLLRDQGFGDAVGLDVSDEALAFCRDKGFRAVLKADVTRLPFGLHSTDLVLATDVLEHVEDDAAAMREIARVLKPGGAALVTVPAFAGLWGLQDEVAHHKRRYRKIEVERLATSAGLDVQASYYFNYILFAPIFLARRLMRLARPNVRSENELNSPLVNRALSAIFAFDVATARMLCPPFGVSALVIATKPRS